MGSNYVLGTRDDENMFTPFEVNPKHFNDNRVKQIGLGIQHVVALSTGSTEPSELPVFDNTVLDLPPVELEKPEEPVKAGGMAAADLEALSENSDIDAPKAVPEANGQPDGAVEEPMAGVEESKEAVEVGVKRTMEQMENAYPAEEAKPAEGEAENGDKTLKQ